MVEYRRPSIEMYRAADTVKARAQALSTIFNGPYTTADMLTQVARLTQELEQASCTLRTLAA